MNIFFRKLSFLVLLSVVICLTSCSKDDDNIDNEASFSTGPIELPAFKEGGNNLFISHSTRINGNDASTFSLEYDCTKKHARWVAFTFYNLTSQVKVDRTDDWADDPSIPAQYRSDREDFRGYDRGHICASADRVYSDEANRQTFYYSNMSPQYGNFNQNIWADLEGKIRDWGRNNSFRDTMYVAKGGTIDREDQIITYTNRGPNRLPVPKYYYMALLCKKDTRYKAIAFCLDQSLSYSKPYTFSKYAMTIDDLEKLTGIDFFHHLPDDLEDAVEAQLSLTAWPGL